MNNNTPICYDCKNEPALRFNLRCRSCAEARLAAAKAARIALAERMRQEALLTRFTDPPPGRAFGRADARLGV